MPKLVHTGSVIIDQVMVVPSLPEPGGDVVATSAEDTVGGGFNTIVASVRDGLPVRYAGLLGTGDRAAQVRRALAEYEVEIAVPPATERDTGFCVAIVDASAERTFYTYVGAEGLENYGHLAQVRVDPDDLVYVTGYSFASEENADALARWLPELPAGTTVLVDPSPLIGDLPTEQVELLLKAATIFSPNGRETRLLGEREDFSEAVRVLRDRLPEKTALVARDGNRGAWVSASAADPGRWVPAFAVEAVDTNGAGDAHTGVLLAALSRGQTLVEAVERANAAAALAVTKSGPATSPTGAEIDRFLQVGTRKPVPSA